MIFYFRIELYKVKIHPPFLDNPRIEDPDQDFLLNVAPIFYTFPPSLGFPSIHRLFIRLNGRNRQRNEEDKKKMYIYIQVSQGLSF